LSGLILTAAMVAACAPAAPAPTAKPPAAPASAPAAAPAGASAGATDGKQLLAQLVEGAKAEKDTRIPIGADLAPAANDLIAAFNKRFGLQAGFKFDFGSQSEKFGPAVAAVKAGAPQQFDALNGPEDYVLRLVRAEGAESINGWEALLGEVNSDVREGKVKAADLSPAPFTGKALKWGYRLNVLVWNTKLISEADLPKARADLGDPKYKGKFPVPPWVTSFTPGIMVYDKDQWLQTIERIGQNAATVEKYAGGVERMVAGEFSLATANFSDYLLTKAKDPQAPMAARPFTDFVDVSNQMYVVPKGVPNRNTATLWSLWMTTAESHTIRQQYDQLGRLGTPVTEVDKQYKDLLEKSETRVISWFDNPQYLALFDWLGSPEGEAYSKRVEASLTQRQS
jgi:ABC-type Fe3+ transport system substrate-binding protein